MWGGGHGSGTWYDDYTTSCRFCGGTVHVSGGLHRKIAEEGYTEPNKCADCKAFLDSHSDRTLSCKFCSDSVHWSVVGQLMAHLRGGGEPSTCESCKAFLNSTYDKTLTCRDCGMAVPFPKGKQLNFHLKGWDPPTRCEACREARRERREPGASPGQPYRRAADFVDALLPLGPQTRHDGFVDYADEHRTCSDCGGMFVFTAGQQHFFNKQGWDAPRRCPDCRQRKRSGR
jgi:hypothetical protein